MRVSVVVRVTLVNSDTGEETILKGKAHSRCLFMDWITYKNYEIQLRLDNNNDPTVDPILDADIRDATTKTLIKKGVWHHTEKKYDPQSNLTIYTFKFEDLPLRLYTVMTYQLHKISNATFTEGLRLTLVRGEPDEGEQNKNHLT